MLTGIIAGIIAFGITIMAMPLFIQYYHRAKIGGQQMHEDVKQHQAKAGTPTMGGLPFLVVTVIVALLSAGLSGQMTVSLISLLFISILYGLIGFLDDFLKVFRQINEGLKPKQKAGLQALGAIVFYLLYLLGGGHNTLSIFGFHLPIGLLYFVFIFFWLVGFSNAVNLTDGIDGLASISVVISLVTYTIIAAFQGQWSIFIFILTLIGSLLAFFIFNHKPAKIFMGDVGSLALGGILAVLSIELHQEWTLLLVGLIYIIETLSVMMQVTYFKASNGKRIFRMTPLHHHFELGGFSGKGKAWNEWKVDALFWLVGILANALALFLYFKLK